MRWWSARHPRVGDRAWRPTAASVSTSCGPRSRPSRASWTSPPRGLRPRPGPPARVLQALMLLQSQRLERLIEDLPEVTRLEAGAGLVDATDRRHRPGPQVVDRFTVEDPTGRCMRLAPDHAVYCRGDWMRIDQVLGNLLSNALRYARPTSLSRSARPLAGEVGVRGPRLGPRHPHRRAVAHLRALPPRRPLHDPRAGRRRPRPLPGPSGWSRPWAAASGSPAASATARSSPSPSPPSRASTRSPPRPPHRLNGRRSVSFTWLRAARRGVAHGRKEAFCSDG